MRTPVGVALVDRRRGRRLGRTVLAVAIAALGAIALGAFALDDRSLAGLVAIAALGAFQTCAVRRPPPPAVVLGAPQVAAGLTIVLVTALGVLAP